MSANRVSAVVLAVVLVGLAAFLVFIHFGAEDQARFWVSHSHEAIEENQGLLIRVEQAESLGRGFLLNREPRFLGPYSQAEAAAAIGESRLTRLVADNPPQLARVRNLAGLIDQRLSRLDRFVELGRKGDFTAASLKPDPNVSLALEEEISAQSARVSAVEQNLLARRQLLAARSEKLVLITGLTVAGLALAGLLASVFSLSRANRDLQAAIKAAEAAQSARIAGQALIDAIFAHTPDYLYVLEVTDDGRFVVGEINPALAQALGVRAEDIRGRSIDEMLGRRGAVPILAHYRHVVASDRPVLTRDIIPNLPGGARTWESILAPVKNEAGVTDRIIGSTRDITDRAKTEERLAEAQRMESVGHLTGGVAHDFNNLLQVIRGNLELIERTVEGNERAERALRNAIHGADRAAQLTRQLLAFARRQPLDPQVINLSRLVREMAELLRRTLGEVVEVETVIGGGLWNTMADPAQVESAVLNLALNARDAMPEGGRLTVEVANAALDEAYAREQPGVAAGQYVLLAVSDTGTGMTDAVKKKVFDPFFTTKADGKGSGLGLSMVHGFVHQSNGHIRLYSEPGQGTTVRIYLPRSRQPIEPVTETEGASRAGANQTILVVEDEAGVRSAAVAMLQELGYHCEEASDAESALELLRSGKKIDLVFTDVIMPGPISCRELVEAIARARPDLPVLFTSGYTENAIVHQGRLDGGVRLLSKPYSREEMARKVAASFRGDSHATGANA